MAKKRSKKSRVRRKKVSKSPEIVKTSTKPSFNQDHVFLGLMFLLLALICFIRVNFVDLPLERDEGDYGLAGKLILEGAIPYKDVFEQKPPGLFYSYAMVEAIFGSTVSGLRIGFMVVNVFTVLLLGYAIKNILSPVAGFIAATSFALLSLNPSASGFAVQAEHLLVFYIALAFFLMTYYSKTEKYQALLLAGASLAWATTIKQNGLFFILAMTAGVFLLHIGKQGLDKRKLLKEYLYFAGGGIMMAISIALLMAMLGVWQSFIFWSFTFPREFYITTIPFSDGMMFMSAMFEKISSFNPWIWVAGTIGILSIFLTKLKWAYKIWIIVITALSFFSIWPGFRFYGHYWIQIFFGVAICVGALGFAVEKLLARKIDIKLSYGIPLVIFLIAVVASIFKHSDYYFSPDGEELMNEIYGDNPFSESRHVADFIKSLNPDPKTDKLLVVGSEPQILLETGLESPTPHTFLIFVASQHPASRPWRKEYLEMLAKNEAKYAVFIGHPFSWLSKNEESEKFIQSIYIHLVTHYDIIGVADILDVKNTIYKWGEEASDYKRQSQKYVLVLQRK